MPEQEVIDSFSSSILMLKVTVQSLIDLVMAAAWPVKLMAVSFVIFLCIEVLISLKDFISDSRYEKAKGFTKGEYQDYVYVMKSKNRAKAKKAMLQKQYDYDEQTERLQALVDEKIK